MTETEEGERSLLLVTHVHIRQGPNGPQVDDQTAAGIAQWCRHFDRVTFMGIAAEGRGTDAASTTWVETNQGIMGARAQLIALPHVYAPRAMLAALRPVRAQLREAVAGHRHLCFTLGGILGDWPFVAALEAIGQKRSFSAWIDRVEPVILRNRLEGQPLKRLALELILPFIQGGIRHVLGKSCVALLQGGDTFDYYARSAPNPHCTYDTHTSAEDQIDLAAQQRKQARAIAGAPLRITYIGRAAAMKGPFDWLETLKYLHLRNVFFEATWIGDGPDLPALREQVAALGLTERITLPGFEARRDVLLQRMRDSDLLVFCHKTPESARCLIEALVCGCPILGYDAAYPRRLLANHGGGVLTAPHDPYALAAAVEKLHDDRTALGQLMAQAARTGSLYSEDAVYRHRADLMRQG